MNIIYLTFKYFEYFFIIYLGLSSIYILIFALAGIARKKITYPKNKIKNRIAVFIPCYKEDSVIINTAKSAILQKYPLDKFEIIVIADSFLKQTLDELESIPVRIINVSFKNSTKAKALNKAFEIIKNTFDIAIILDADNIMEPLFLDKINNAFNKNFKAIQGHRKAKNFNTAYAILDGVSEEVNNNIFRQGHRTLKMSSALIGSGMAFEYNLLKNTMKKIDAISGFDKELELLLIQQKITVEYLDNAIVYDEKIQKASHFRNQRRRWLSSKITFFKKYAPQVFHELFLKGNIVYVDKIYQMIAPPRIILLGGSFLVSLLYFLLTIFGYQTWLSEKWLFIFLTTFFAIVISVPKGFFNRKFVYAVFFLPSTFIQMIISILSLKKAYKKFIHTPHSSKFN